MNQAILRSLLVLLLLLSLSLVMALPASASSPGDLDTTFDTDGKVTTDFGGNDMGQSVAIQSDGKIVAVGVYFPTPSTGDFAVARYNTNGSLDTTFDTDGKVTTSFGDTGRDQAWAVAIQGDGKIVAVGDTTATPDNRNFFALARYNTDGSLDSSFDTDGKVTTDFGTTGDNSPLAQGLSVALQSDGKIVVAGAFFKFNSTTGWDFALARYNADGSLDTSFGGTGKVITNIGAFQYGSGDAATSVAIQSDGKIVATGYGNPLAQSNSDFAVARFNTNGSLDTSFDTDGKVTTDFGSNADYGYSVAIQSDSKIVVAGKGGGTGDFALARYNTNGSLDTSFDTDGKVTTNFGGDDPGQSVAIQSDGRIVAAGYTSAGANLDFAVARYNTNGSLDTSFDTDGKVTTDFGGGPDAGHSVAIQGDGNIVVSGSGGGGTGEFALARYSGTVPPVVPPQTNLSLSPDSQTVVAGDLFTITIRVTPQGGQQVAAVDAFVNFDPAVLQVDSIVRAPGSLFAVDIGSNIDNTNGYSDFSGGQLTGTAPSTPFDLAVITLHGVGAATNSPVTFSTVAQDPLRNTGAAYSGADVTGTRTGATVTVLVLPVANFTGVGAVSGTQTVAAGETVNFADTSTGPPTSWDWDFDASTSSTDSTSQNPTHVYNVVGQYSVRLTATNAAGNNTVTKNTYITVVPGPLHHITVSPASPSLVVGGTQTFTAATFDQFNNVRTGDPIDWSVGNATAGSIDSSTGAFTAGTAADTYNNVIVALSGPLAGNASVIVTAGALHHITVSPTTPTLAIGGAQTFTAATFDQFNNPRAGDPITWSLANIFAGSIDSSTGAFTAGTLSGTWNNVIVATSGTVTGNISLQITPDPVHHITVSPASPSLQVGSAQTFTAFFYDQYNNARNGTVAWSVSDDTAGSIIDAGTGGPQGAFTAGTVAGSYTNVVVATSGAVTGNASVTVTPGPLASITVSPSHPTVAITTTQTFTALGLDSFGNARTGLDTFTWSVADASSAAGAINANTGVFTATSNIANVADYTNAILGTSGAISGTASVNVVGGIINGSVTLQGSSRPALQRLVGVTVKLFTSGATDANLRAGTGSLATFTTTTADPGNNNVTFQIVGLVPGSYDITIVSNHTLMNVKKNVTVVGGTNAVTFGPLLEGNCNNDQQVTALDFSILAASYLKSPGQAGFDARADFDGTGQVNSLDFSLLAANYLKSSPIVVP